MSKIYEVAQWLRSFWPIRDKEVARQYRVMASTLPLVMADLAQKCHFFEDVYDPDAEQATFIAIGERRVFIHIMLMSGMNERELNNILEEMKDEHRPGRRSRDDIDGYSSE